MVIIRLTRAGKRNRPYYRVVAVDHRAKRDGRPLELLGTYDPVPTPPAIALRTERIEAWQKNGAQLSGAVRSLVRRARKLAPAAAATTDAAQA
jgi:small subunit ribosomal protein S16